MGNFYRVVDLFAGPGGLGEGFATLRSSSGVLPFRSVLSVENESSAHHTLLLRNFLHKFGRAFPPEYYAFLNYHTPEPDWRRLYPREWNEAETETLNLKLGSTLAKRELRARLSAIRRKWGDHTILIGGPPCQAYSLVGRARNRGIEGYQPKADHRHFLYREFIDALNELKPSAFVMENVKGILSANIDGRRIFDSVARDLRKAGGGYRLVPLFPSRILTDDEAATPRDFVVRSEDFGIPQARHRVIIVGIRSDLRDIEARVTGFRLIPKAARATTKCVLSDMPTFRSTLSKEPDSDEAWRRALIEGAQRMERIQLTFKPDATRQFRTRLVEIERALKLGRPRARWRTASRDRTDLQADLVHWIEDDRLAELPNNEPRGHMVSDLERYLFATVFAEVIGRSPRAAEFPNWLAPKHRNWTSGKFADRFRVQLPDLPSSTITSHISKDGHYFIHPDPLQCRSLTVREAARLQTFPDNYLFKGNRTQQYVQVGNAVPPYLAHQIARTLYLLLSGRDSF